MSRLARVLVAAVALVLAVAPSAAAADDGYRIVLSRIDASDFPTVRFVASIVDGTGRPAKGIRREDLQLTEGSASPSANMRLASLVAPVTLAFVIDTSGSMAGRPIADVKAAVGTMVRQLGATDQVAVVAFDVTPRLVQAMTADKQRAVAAIDALGTGGDTAIYDAVAMASDVLDAADPRSRRAIVLLTDGVDNRSRVARDAITARLGGAPYPLYAIGLGASIERATLDALSGATTGGATLLAPTPAQVAGIYAGLSEQLSTEYSIDYRSPTRAFRGTTVAFELALWRSGRIVARTTGTFVVPASGPEPASPSPARPSLEAPVVAPATEAASDAVPISSTWVVGLLGAATTLLLLLWVYELILQFGTTTRRRLRVFVRGAEATTNEPERKRSAASSLIPPLRAVARPFLRILPARYIAATRHRLELAGEPLSEIEFIGLQITAAVVGAFGATLAFVALLPDSALGAVLGALLGLLIGFILPGLVVDSLARRRRKAIRRALVPSLDMLALSVEAGLAFDAAISQVVQRWHNPLSDELRRLLLEFQMGRDRKQALRELARRSGVPDLAKFVNAVIQADTLGVGLARTLQEQAVELRTKRRQRAEELARVAPIKMMFPMVLLIFPALFVVILGPAVPRLLSMFGAIR